ncbi:hypothetical protein LTS16_026121 [Friedmanniomyces endolithicus]|nr:hypothetical protein LTR57_024961 [Friedmanniomyces endolithicus]KAK1021940.1 hypothetical protein LTS16_026121 [Friedmanniomyces endolithicus]
MPGGYAERGARQNRKRGIANIPGGNETSSPTKRGRLNVLNARFPGINELAKITESAGTEFPAMVEPNGTDCSRFRTTAHLRPHLGIDWQSHAVEQFSIMRRPDAAVEDDVTYGDRVGQLSTVKEVHHLHRIVHEQIDRAQPEIRKQVEAS